MIRLKYLRFRLGKCSLCGRTIFIKLGNSYWSIRCLRCGGSITAMNMAFSLKYLVHDYRPKEHFINF